MTPLQGVREWHSHSSAISQPLSTSSTPTSLPTSLLTFALQAVLHAHLLLLGVGPLFKLLTGCTRGEVA